MTDGRISAERTYTERAIAYGEGKVLDVYRSRDHEVAPVVLFWHGSGPDERDVLDPLAHAIARQGPIVVIPDWQSDNPAAPDQLRASIRFSLQGTARFGSDGKGVVIAGWSSGANAAVAIALRPELVDGWRPRAVVGIAGGYDDSPFGRLGLSEAGPSASPIPTHLLHGSEDAVVSVERSRLTAGRLNAGGWPVVLEELPTDHAGIIGTEYDPYLRRCVPTHERAATEAKAHVGWRIAEVAAYR
jgi:predicted esterase